jgi:hypothetical protein
LNVHGVNDGNQTEVHTAEPLLLEPSACMAELAVEMLKTHQSQDTDHIPAALIKVGCRTIHSKICKLINLFSLLEYRGIV